MGARKLHDGGILYIDYIDVKPPLIFVLYSAIDVLVGARGIALADVLIHSCAVWCLLQVLQRYNATRSQSWAVSITYVVLHVTLGIGQTAQTETWFCPLLAIALFIISGYSTATSVATVLRSISLGSVLAAMFMLKYTFAVSAIPILFLTYRSISNLGPSLHETPAAHRGPRWVLHGGLIMTGFIAAASVILSIVGPLSDVFIGITNLAQYLAAYSSVPPIGLDTVTNGLQRVGEFLGDNIGITTMSLFAFGLLYVRTRNVNWRMNTETTLYGTLAVLFVVLLATVFLERRYFPYHFARLYLPLSMFVGLGIRHLVSESRWRMSFSTIVFCGIAVLFTPIPRYVKICGTSARSVASPSYAAALRSKVFTDSESELVTLERGIRSWIQPKTSWTVMSWKATPLLPELEGVMAFPFGYAGYFTSPEAPNTWKEAGMHALQRSDIVFVDTIDVLPMISLHDQSSWHSIRGNEAIRGRIDSTFTSVDTIGTIIVLQRRPK